MAGVHVGLSLAVACTYAISEKTSVEMLVQHCDNTAGAGSGNSNGSYLECACRAPAHLLDWEPELRARGLRRRTAVGKRSRSCYSLPMCRLLFNEALCHKPLIGVLAPLAGEKTHQADDDRHHSTKPTRLGAADHTSWDVALHREGLCPEYTVSTM